MVHALECSRSECLTVILGLLLHQKCLGIFLLPWMRAQDTFAPLGGVGFVLTLGLQGTCCKHAAPLVCPRPQAVRFATM